VCDRGVLGDGWRRGRDIQRTTRIPVIPTWGIYILVAGR